MKSLDEDKTEFCTNLDCDDRSEVSVCGIRIDGKGFRVKYFKNECELLKYGCKVDNSKAYGLINSNYCEKSNGKLITNDGEELMKPECDKYDCANESDKLQVCGIRQEGKGFKVRLFHNECQLWKYNCENKLKYNITDYHICNGLSITVENKHDTEYNEIKQLIVVDGTIFNRNNNVNDTIDNFFAATHVFDMPMQEVKGLNATTRRMLLNIAGPVKVFKPWITIPKNISDDYYHRPTLSSCYHKCPMKCPDTYAPVCGVPGIVAREPSIMFQNHCFMDVAQCKMQWEDKSPTALSSFYIESSFLFCLGDELNGLYRFLPLIRTLQHMGRLKKKGHFRYKLKNMRFFNNLLSREPKLMG
ncbi:uncharacterized protein LOC115439869 [Manduca sexta]|uniref:uncharacterized protein LOC115439869 n=1 Tax=Manduca sexta TaxID=7130 RepID=UPI00188F7AE6|nr:uncharacterized protein LOC115439869 [Manduca sexta]